ncbi:hypothetical protein CJU90_0598 [Yarrowia sp. C11]|nr:hypothetical protein CKK34_2010 [Yarrowia sp. E02]KAG5372937.1 hypothetical protein CJU90_0598 [Yarrowia sp. C11]
MNLVAKGLVVAFLVINAKSISFSWTIRFFYYFWRYCVFPKWLCGYGANDKPASPFAEREYHTRCTLMECDINVHKSNSTYFSDLDIARSDLMIWLLNKFLRDTHKANKRWAVVPVGSVYCNFKKEIKPLQKYTIISRILGWNQKWLVVESRFEIGGRKNPVVAATALTKYVVKDKRKTIPPCEALKMTGFTEEQCEEGLRRFESVKGFLEIEGIEA